MLHFIHPVIHRPNDKFNTNIIQLSNFNAIYRNYSRPEDSASSFTAGNKNIGVYVICLLVRPLSVKSPETDVTADIYPPPGKLLKL